MAVTEDDMLRVCSYNIHKGVCAANRTPILQQLRHAIRTVNTDLVFLQEVVGERTGSTLDYPQFEYLADEVWDHHAYGQNAIYQKGHHGNAVLSKFPFLHLDNIDISRWRFSQRGILFGQLSVGVYVACIHFGLLGRERRQQLASLMELIVKRVPDGAPLIIAGDFNDWGGVIHRKMVSGHGFGEAYYDIYGRSAKTFPARFPVLPMDRIYYRNIELIDAEVLSGKPWQNLSDHCALFASFKIPA